MMKPRFWHFAPPATQLSYIRSRHSLIEAGEGQIGSVTLFPTLASRLFYIVNSLGSEIGLASQQTCTTFDALYSLHGRRYRPFGRFATVQISWRSRG